MTNREKVIKGLNDIGCFIAGRMGFEQARNFLRTIDDALAMLKEQDVVKPTWQQGKAYCGSCGKRIPLKIGARYCHKCGKPISWERRVK